MEKNRLLVEKGTSLLPNQKASDAALRHASQQFEMKQEKFTPLGSTQTL